MYLMVSNLEQLENHMEDQTSIVYHAAKLILLFRCLITTSCMAYTTIKTDQSALIALKSSISSDPQHVISTNWSNSSPVCSWIGITCSSRHQRVMALNISHMSLEGKIPPQLGNLSFLVSLSMRNNSFYGSLPPELANLRRLRSVDLRSNKISGPIPSFFGSLPNLKFLYLWENEFSGSIPTSIANISKLEELGLSYNSLQGQIPEEIGNLSYLTYLNLENSGLTGHVPWQIYNLSALHNLALTRNDFTGKLPESICDTLPLLQGLYLTDNRFYGTIPSSLQKCDQLQDLSLSQNQFSGSLPREIGNSTSLRELYLGYNNLEGPIPKEISNLRKLRILDFSYNNLGGLIPESIFNMSTLQGFASANANLSGTLPPCFGLGIPNLQELVLHSNSLSGVIPVSISNASKLMLLELSGNSFTGPIPDALGNLEFLVILNLIANKFTSLSSPPELSFITSLTKCRYLKRIMVANNPLDGKLPISIGNFSTSLQIFGAYACQIRGKVPQEIGNLSTLAKLSLYDNELIGNIPTTLIGLSKLQELYLYNNNIVGFIPNEICSLGNLGILDLSQNNIFGSFPVCVENMTSLRILQLASNKLDSSLPVGIWKLNDILELNASSNMLSGHLPPEIGNLKVVTLIDLSMNNLSGDIPTAIGGLERLINLSLAHNRLGGPIPYSLSGALSLETLDLSHNYLTGEIPMSLEALLYLRYLNLSFNKLIGEIPKGGPFVNFTYMSFISNEALCGASRFEVLKCQAGRPKRKNVLRIALYTILAFASVTIGLVVLVLLMCRKRKKYVRDQTLGIPPLILHERISYEELQEATDRYCESNILGIGAFGSVYKGRLRDGLQVAVKVFNNQFEGGFRSFDTECEVLRSLRHRNLTKVISSCTNLNFRALVLEYMSSGSLEKWLYSHNYFLDILQRLDIVIDVAYALDYLHNGYLVPVLHCDLKPSNVLLDNELVGHVCDFGISKILGAGEDIARTKTLATIGYIAPEYGLEGLVSTRSDIYSYGILLMETFTRMKPSNEMFVGELSLKQWIKDSLPSDITQVVDSSLITQEEENFDAKLQCLSSIMELALKCTEEIPELRISINDVATMLNKIKIQFLTSCGRVDQRKMDYISSSFICRSPED